MSDTYADNRRRDTLREREASAQAAWARRQDFARWTMIEQASAHEEPEPALACKGERCKFRAIAHVHLPGRRVIAR